MTRPGNVRRSASSGRTGRGRKARTKARSRRPARRYGSRMPLRDRLVLALGWLAVQVVGFVLLDAWTQRLGLALLSLLALPLVVTLWMSPRSSR